MRPEELLCAEALVLYLGDPKASFTGVENDPPDLMLTVGGRLIGVEVTQTVDFTCHGEEVYPDRRSQDSYGLRLLDQLEKDFGPSIPRERALMVSLFLPVSRPRYFKDAFHARVRQLIDAPSSTQFDEQIDGTRVRMKVIARTGRAIVGAVHSVNTSADIVANAALTLQTRIDEKSRRCRKLRGPLWLAILNTNPLADGETYEGAAQRLGSVKHRFDRILMVMQNRQVIELSVESAEGPAVVRQSHY